MNLPDTQNAHHVHAFKKGYRLALEGKPLTNMPSTFRFDRTLREYYEQGWSQAYEELEAGHQANLEKPWRSRIAWTIVIVLGSIATAVGMINGIKQEQKEQQARILGLNEGSANKNAALSPTVPITETIKAEPVSTSIAKEFSLLNSSTTPLESQNKSEPAQTGDKYSSLEKPQLTTPSKKSEAAADKPVAHESAVASSSLSELSLLSNAQREDLVLNKLELLQQQSNEVMPQMVIDSSITVKSALLTTHIQNKQAVDSLIGTVPKRIRKLYFFTEIEDAEDKALYHRWIFKNQEMALIELEINSNLYRTWSSKQMSSAWQGLWTVELLNENRDVIYRQSFQYGNQASMTD